ncbi:MAG: 5'/3'-nucleotidase SurE [Leptospiraceae bacterium]|nr:5'/3'-nucleotidase SurE [Leptospiraceae bacterium]MCP5501342.1 5'/3'-nucleotidase SurE [Leptospiraceae bacterium]
MNILISNDDGIACNGILALEKVLQKKHKVFLVAPLKEKSATSQAMSIFDTLRVERVNDNHYIVDGFPVDCVNIGLHGKIFPFIDMVISGINRGVNMGYDVHYSGTVGAARHGAINNCYALAVSSGKLGHNDDYIEEAEFISSLIEEKFEYFKKKVVYNINLPPGFNKNLSELEITKPGIRTYKDEYKVQNIIGNVFEFCLGGSELGHRSMEGSDFDAYDRGNVSITPLSLESLHEGEYTDMKQYFHGTKI